MAPTFPFSKLTWVASAHCAAGRPAAAVQIRDVCPKRASARCGVAEFLYRGGAYALGPEVNNAASRIYAVEGGCFGACALRDRLEGNMVEARIG